MKTDSAWLADVRLHTRRELAAVGQRLARAVAATTGESTADASRPAHPGDAPHLRSALSSSLDFAAQFAAELAPATAPPPPGHPLPRLLALLPPAQQPLLRDLLLLACLPDAHEGYAALCRQLHPQGQPLPTGVLALQWLEHEAGPGADRLALRDEVEGLLVHGTLARMGLWRLPGEGPWHSRGLQIGPGVWAALMARPPQLGEGAQLVGGYAQVPGLADWLSLPGPAQAVLALRRGLPCRIVLTGGDTAMRATRVRALLGAAPAAALRQRVDAGPEARSATTVGAAYLAAFMQQAALWLETTADADGAPPGAQPAAALPDLDWALPLIQTAHSARELHDAPLPLIHVPVTPLAPPGRRALWRSLLPQLGEHAGALAVRYPIEPDDARDVVRDLALRQSLTDAPLAIADVGDCIRHRTPWMARPGMQRLTPQAGWAQLLLPTAARAQLQAAVRRVAQQITVLDDWGFAQGRDSRRGVRLLFCGAPGTGKTLAAEAMAHELGVDLMVVDLASLVSKWIGETEKNLAAVFDVAERARSLLLFDEADALFGRRTEARDAHDRHANLETAYLLQRLERFEGMAVLTTNLRANLDSAFARRFEFIVEFPEPDAAAREALWHLHLPASAPRAADVDLAELAGWYALTGAQIKNAALGAAFLAAAEGSALQQRHFLQAVEREFDKAGRAHPGFPPRRPAGAPPARADASHAP